MADDAGVADGTQPEDGRRAVMSAEPPAGAEASAPEKSRRSWVKVAVLVGGAVVTAAGSAMVTLAATHKSAVFENAKAYANGMNDALNAVRNGFDPHDF